MIIIVIHVCGICTENVIRLIACLLRIQLLQHTDIVGHVWVITVTLFGSYSTVQIEITVAYSDSTLGYIQSFPVSTSLEYAGMKHVKRDKTTLIK